MLIRAFDLIGQKFAVFVSGINYMLLGMLVLVQDQILLHVIGMPISSNLQSMVFLE